MLNDIQNYHENRTALDYTFIESLFDRDDRTYLKKLQSKYPKHIIRLSNADLIAQGFVKGIGGSVPANWNGLYHDLSTSICRGN